MNKKYIRLILISMLLLSIFLRSYLSLSQDYFYDDKSYQLLRQVEDISEKKSTFHDELSYGGRTLIYSPLFHYLLSLVNSLFGISGLKIFMSIISSLMIYLIFFISMNITKNVYISLFTAFTSIFIPVFVKNTYNSLSTLPMVLLLTFYAIYQLLVIKKNDHKKIYAYVFTIILLGLLSPLSVIYILGTLLYLLIANLSSIRVSKAVKESIIYSTFFLTWVQFILYKNAFLEHGINVIWQNLPVGILEKHFVSFSVPEAIYQIGFILFICGIYVLYKNLFTEKNTGITLFFSFAVSILLLLLLKLIPQIVGMIFLGFIMVILFSYFLSLSFTFIKRIYLTGYNTLFVLVLFALIVIGSVIPTMIEVYESHREVPSRADIGAFIWLNENIPEDSVVLTPVSQGHLLTYFAQKKNVMDTNFILVDKVDERFAAVNEIYQTPFKSNAIRRINHQKVNYLTLTDLAKKEYQISKFHYVEDDCFKEVYNKNNVSIYESLCFIE